MATLALSLGACAHSGGPIEGRVVEDGTNRAVPGAIVVAFWQGSTFELVESHTVCYHVESASTDTQGVYRIPRWSGTTSFFVSDPQVHVFAYYPGYLWNGRILTGVKDETTFVVKSATGSGAERFKTLSQLFGIFGGCSSATAGMSFKALLPLKSEIYKEMKSLAKSPAELMRVKQLRESIAYDTVETEQDKGAYTEDMRRRVKRYLEEHPE